MCVLDLPGDLEGVLSGLLASLGGLCGCPCDLGVHTGPLGAGDEIPNEQEGSDEGCEGQEDLEGSLAGPFSEDGARSDREGHCEALRDSSTSTISSGGRSSILGPRQ